MKSDCCHNSNCSSNKFNIKSLYISLILFAFFIIINQSGAIPSVIVDSNTFLPIFLFFGLTAALSTCGALLTGIMLSLGASSTPFLISRLIFFPIFGFILGLIGNSIKISPLNFSLFIIFISLILIINSLKMIGLKCFQSINIRFPQKFLKTSPVILGALTFFLPCGFTFTAQTLALASSRPLTGSLIMFFFVLGSTLPIFLIPISKLKTSPVYSQSITLLILFFSLFSINSQLSILSIHPFSLAKTSSETFSQVDDYQVIKMVATAQGYIPNSFVVKVGQPIRWIIKNSGANGCTNRIISPSLFPDQINLISNDTTIKEFTPPTSPGIYHFSCWMGMYQGTIKVIN